METATRVCIVTAVLSLCAGCAMTWEQVDSLIKEGRLDDAEKLARQELTENPSYRFAEALWERLGDIHVRKRNDDEATTAYLKCIELSTVRSDGSYARNCASKLAPLYERAGNVEEAKKWFLLCRQHWRGEIVTQCYEGLTRFASQKGELNEVVRYSSEAVATLKDEIQKWEGGLTTPSWIPGTRQQLRVWEAKLEAAKTAARQAAQTAAAPSSAPSLELALWDSVKTSTIPGELQAYLQKFPNGTFAELARARLSALGEAPVQLTPIAAPTPGTINFGRYHALVIGINAYRQVTPLKTAVNDARTVADVLTRDYGFEVSLLIDATRNQILDAFDDLRRTLTEADNLLIYYAGHGYLDRDSDRGFWLPIDAHKDRRSNWLSNADIADTVRGTRAKHVLVVADSCYAGTLTRSLSVQMTGLDDFARLAQKRARTALVSGGLEPVEDAGGGNHSVFAKSFLDQLRANTGVMDMSQMFSAMRRQVILAAQQTPQYGDIRQTGHEGGDFIFVRRTAR